MENIIELTDKIYNDVIKELSRHPETREYCESDYGDAKLVIEIVIKSEVVGSLLYKFWQRSSDACPIECVEAEKQEDEFKEWVMSLDWDTLYNL